MGKKSYEEIFTEIVPIIANESKIEQSEIGMNYHFIKDLKCSEMGKKEIFLQIEELFEIRILHNRFKKVKTIKDLIDFLVIL